MNKIIIIFVLGVVWSFACQSIGFPIVPSVVSFVAGYIGGRVVTSIK